MRGRSVPINWVTEVPGFLHLPSLPARRKCLLRPTRDPKKFVSDPPCPLPLNLGPYNLLCI